MHAIKLDEKTGEVEIGKASTRSRYVKYNVIKRVFDIILSVIVLALAAPIILLCAIVVRLSSKGSPLYSQRRLGCRGRVFTIYKIRTMYPDSERSSEAVWAGSGDPRVTPVGRILRCCHLDELPQLVNILIGDMSLIGPRPERPEIAAQVQLALPDYPRRLEIRPGLTGLAQVLQDPDVDLQSVRRKVNYDLFYLNHMSFWLDLRIVLATVLHVAYLPAWSIARIFRFPYVAQHGEDDSSLLGESIPVSSRVHPHYAN